MPKTRQPKPAKKPKTPSRGRKPSPPSASRSSSSTTTPPLIPLSVPTPLLSEKDLAKIVSILQETVDQITAQHERRLDALYERSQNLGRDLRGTERSLENLRKRTNEAAVALLQR